MNSTPFQIKGYDHDGVLLNLSGIRDEDECVIDRVTVEGSDQNLVDLFPVNTLCLMAERADAQLEREAQKHNVAARVERHQWHREFAIAA